MKKIAIAMLTLMFFLISCSGSGQVGKSQYEKGLKALLAGETARALEILQEAANNYPDAAYARFGMATYYEKEGFHYEALDACSRIIRKDPEFTPALLMSARLSLKVDRPELAFFFASLYRDAGGEIDSAAAIEAEAMIAAGKIEDAVKGLDEALSEKPGNPQLMMLRARCDIHSGLFGEGIAKCHEAVSTAEPSPGLYRSAGDFFREMGLFDSAMVYYEKGVALSPNDYYYNAGIADAFIDMNYFRRADNLMAPYLKNFPASNVYWDLKSKYYQKQRKYVKSDESYGMIVPNHSKSPSVLSRFSWTRMRIGDDFASERYFETAVTLAQIDTLANIAFVALRMEFTDVLFQLGQFRNAQPVVDALLDSLPNDFKAIYNGCYYSMMVSDRDRLRNLLQVIRPTIKNNPAFMTRMAYLYNRLDSLEIARNLAMAAIDMDKLNIDAILELVKTAEKQNRPSDAMAIINGFDEYVSYNPRVAEKKLDLYDTLGEFNSGMLFAEQLTKLAPEDLSRYYRAAGFALKLGDRKKTEEYYQMSLDNNPNDPAAYTIVGKYFLSRNDLKKAESNMEKALSMDSLWIDALVLKGDLAAARGERDNAVDIYQKVVDMDQYASDAVGGIALQGLLRGDNPHVSANWAMKAISYDGGNAWHRNTLGRAYYAQQKYKLAYNSFKVALELDPNNPLINYYAGINMVKMDTMKFEAKLHLQKAVKDGLPKDLESDARKALNLVNNR
ncbi:MAG: tetratricopeptide repeat protein [Candidatus Zixiibacteriota bacterium]